MLTGEYFHVMDKKGRVNVPARMREVLGDRFMVAKGIDRCLFIYPAREWAALVTKLRNLPGTDHDLLTFMRKFFSGAAEVELDRQARMLIPPPLREYASLQKEVVFIGVSNRAELWSKEKWNEYDKATNLPFEVVTAKTGHFPF